MARPGEGLVRVCEWGPGGAGRTLMLKTDEQAGEPAEIILLGFLEPNNCAGLSSSTSPRFRVEIEEV